MISRRRFLELGSLAGASFFLPKFLKSFEPEVQASGKRLIIVELTGGNDGLNTVVPFRNDIYFKSRPSVYLKKSDILQLTDEAGLHGTLKKIRSLYDEGNLAIINSVGYPQQSRSHFQSMEVWHSAFAKPHSKTGWLGRYLDTIGHDAKTFYEINETNSLALKGKYGKGIAVSSKAGNMLNSDYPDTEIGSKMRRAAHLIKRNETNVIYVSHGSFDTHVNQKEHHHHLLKELDTALESLINDLKQNGLFKDTLILTFSEFGRGVRENEYKGTDHGAANNMFVINGSLKKAGLYNSLPDLNVLDDGAIKYEIDFRQVYATVLDRWLGTDAKIILGKTYAPLNFV